MPGSESRQMLQQLWLALNAEFGHGLPKNGKPVKPPARVRHCRVCNRASKGLMKCGGGCKQYAHAKCVGLADKASVSRGLDLSFPSYICQALSCLS